jgi:hypothetical protein
MAYGLWLMAYGLWLMAYGLWLMAKLYNEGGLMKSTPLIFYIFPFHLEKYCWIIYFFVFSP